MQLRKLLNPVYLYFLFVAFFFVQVINSIYSTNILSQTRVFLIVLIIIFGWYLNRGKDPKAFGRTAIYLATYMSCAAILQLGFSDLAVSNIISFFFWVIVLHQVKGMRINEYDVGVIALIMSVACNICAIQYSYYFLHWRFELDHDARIAAVNSIYYILTMLPFVFYLKKWWLSLPLSILPFYAFVVSSKTTCLLCAILILAFNLWYNISKLKWGSKLAFLVALCCCVTLAVNNIDFALMNSDISDDFDSGGNGRTEIALSVLGLLEKDDNPIYLIFGHGVNAISAKIGIGGHNDYLELLYCYGIIGLLLFLGFWKELLKGLKWFNKEPDLKIGFVISLIVLLFSTLASKLLATQVGMLSLSLLWGVTYAYNRSKLGKI